MSVIDEIKQKTDIVDIVSQYTSLKKAGRNLTALCPFHSEKRPSFFVYPEQQSWHCFGACNSGGDVFSFVMKKQGIDFGETLRLLGQRAGVTIPSRFEPDARKDERERLYQANETAAQYFHNLLLNSPAAEKARNYLASRSISAKTVSDFQLGFSLNSWEALKQYLLERGYAESELLEAGLLVETEDGKTHDRFRHRLIFPINDSRSHTTGFGARVLDDSLPKYLNSPQTPAFDKSSSLYGINLAAPAIRQQNQAVIVEGYTDVITAHQNGFTNVVATMGTAVTEKQLTFLKKLSNAGKIALALDADAAGEEATLRSINYENSLDIEVKFVILPKGKDPDDVIREDSQAWQAMVDGALPVVDYTFTRDESLAIDRLLPIIAMIKDDLRRDRYLTKLAKLSGHAYKKLELESALQGYLTRQKVKEPKSEAVARVVHSLHSSPLEEYCLALLLQHLQLKNKNEGLLTEYFENSENREVFTAWQQTDDLSSLKARLDTTIWEHLDALINKKIPSNRIEQKYANCVLRLREKFLRALETKKGAALTLEAETGGTVAEMAKLKEQGIEVSTQLREVFTQKASRDWEQRR
ncbi:MAG: DNA primase [Chloroflexi bacterium]|nr:DNA primase [Chloroflexota bacterium]